MIYSVNSKIHNIHDVEEFFHHIVFERKVNFHPDDSFEQYICLETHKLSFSEEECKIYNSLMDDAFDICERERVDIYEIGFNELTSFMNKGA